MFVPVLEIAQAMKLRQAPRLSAMAVVKARVTGRDRRARSVTGFLQWSMRGLKKVSGEWTLVCPAWNVKRIAGLRLKVG